jgi:hypothetical protein
MVSGTAGDPKIFSTIRPESVQFSSQSMQRISTSMRHFVSGDRKMSESIEDSSL